MQIYRIKLTLRHVKPPVWRRIEVPADVTLDRMHDVIQLAMGWSDSHLHGFRVGRESYGVVDPDLPGDFKDERKARLKSLAGQGDTFVYDYDFGDGWEHELCIEKTMPAEPGVRYPRCIEGKRACPPEDCGGPWGYSNLLAAIGDPTHEEHDELQEWLGDDFDPEFFDIDEVNEAYGLEFEVR